MIRLAVAADATEIEDFQEALFKLRPQRHNTLARIGARHIITIIEPSVGYCQIKVREDEQAAKVEALFPRAEPEEDNIDALAPILGETLWAVLDEYPRAGKWWVWGQFWYPKDDQGEYDGGKSACEAWAARIPGARVVPPDKRDNADGLWRIEYEIEAAAEALTSGRRIR